MDSLGVESFVVAIAVGVSVFTLNILLFLRFRRGFVHHYAEALRKQGEARR